MLDFPSFEQKRMVHVASRYQNSEIYCQVSVHVQGILHKLDKRYSMTSQESVDV